MVRGWHPDATTDHLDRNCRCRQRYYYRMRRSVLDRSSKSKTSNVSLRDVCCPFSVWYQQCWRLSRHCFWPTRTEWPAKPLPRTADACCGSIGPFVVVVVVLVIVGFTNYPRIVANERFNGMTAWLYFSASVCCACQPYASCLPIPYVFRWTPFHVVLTKLFTYSAASCFSLSAVLPTTSFRRQPEGVTVSVSILFRAKKQEASEKTAANNKRPLAAIGPRENNKAYIKGNIGFCRVFSHEAMCLIVTTCQS